MRSQPPPSPSALPPILDDLATILPLPKKAYRSKDDSDIPLADLDPETSRLIQPKRRTHRVWVQGRLAAVRTVSNKLRRKGSGVGKDAVDPDLVSGKVSSRRSLEEDLEQVDEEAEHETERRARQLRGYGIGGIGNIRRPTDVIYGPNRPAAFAISQPELGFETPPTSPLDEQQQKWNLRDFLALRPDDKGKQRVL